MEQIFDAFLELIGGNVPAYGETIDAAFAAKKAIEIDHFEFGGLESLAKDFAPPEDPASGWDEMSLEGDDMFELDNLDSERDAPKAIQHFSIEKQADNSSPNLFQAYCSSSLPPAERHSYTSAKVSIRKNSGGVVVFMEFVFGDVYVVEYSFDAKDEGPPKETVKFSFRTVELYYYPQNPDGSMASPITATVDFSLVD